MLDLSTWARTSGAMRKPRPLASSPQSTPRRLCGLRLLTRDQEGTKILASVREFIMNQAAEMKLQDGPSDMGCRLAEEIKLSTRYTDDVHEVSAGPLSSSKSPMQARTNSVCNDACGELQPRMFAILKPLPV